MSHSLPANLALELENLRALGLYKEERPIASRQGPEVTLSDSRNGQGGHRALNFCANDYLGLAGHPALVAAAHEGLDQWGYGMASVRFICGTQEVHKRLEARLAAFLGKEDAILFPSCFDANGGIFEALLGDGDAVISDELNHASIIDGIRLCKARRLRYRNNDLADLEAKLTESVTAKVRIIVTDGVFSMDGSLANLKGICALGKAHDALVMVDDSHATGVLGAHGRGSPEHAGVEAEVDILTGTLGKALGGASGGYVAARREIVAWLRQRARPYLFSNTLPPPVAFASLTAIDLAENGEELRQRLRDNAAHFRAGLESLGYQVLPGGHPIIPVMMGDAARAKAMSKALLGQGVHAVAFSYPVVPQGKARIRVQISAAHTRAQLERALEAFRAVKDQYPFAQGGDAP